MQSTATEPYCYPLLMTTGYGESLCTCFMWEHSVISMSYRCGLSQVTVNIGIKTMVSLPQEAVKCIEPVRILLLSCIFTIVL